MRAHARAGALAIGQLQQQAAAPVAHLLAVHVHRRVWRQMKQYAPFLSALDFLPRFTFTVLGALALVGFLVKCMCFDDDDWLEGSPQPTSEAVLRRRKEREREAEMRKQLAATKAKGILSEAEASAVVREAAAKAAKETKNPAAAAEAEKGTAEKKAD